MRLIDMRKALNSGIKVGSFQQTKLVLHILLKVNFDKKKLSTDWLIVNIPLTFLINIYQTRLCTNQPVTGSLQASNHTLHYKCSPQQSKPLILHLKITGMYLETFISSVTERYGGSVSICRLELITR